MSLVEIKNISKSYDKKVVIDNLSLNIESGKIIGLLGKNGSGKTTLIKLINDLLTLDSGEILIDGNKIGTKTKAVVSYLPERTYFEQDMTVKETFTFFEEFYKDFDRKKAERLLKDLELDENQKLSKMSKGMKEKLQLILVMSRHAKLYILDEPLGGVDPTTRDYIMQTILSNFDDGASLIITTHLIRDIEKILDEVVFIDKGKIVLKANADELREKENSSIEEIFRRILK